MTADTEAVRVSVLDELADHIGLCRERKGKDFTVDRDGLALGLFELGFEYIECLIEWQANKRRFDQPEGTLSLEGELFDVAADALLLITAIRAKHPR